MTPSPVIMLCNGASLPVALSSAKPFINLDYRTSVTNFQNVHLGLPDFIRRVNYIPDRILDLLEIAAYIYSGDRLVSRGQKDDVEYHSWARHFHYVIKVRDYDFWNQARIKTLLSEALVFLSGDASYSFTFEAGHSTSRVDLFDKEEFQLQAAPDTQVLLFSGGLDSLTGALERLEASTGYVYLVSHQSQTGVARTQNQLYQALSARFPQRVKHYKFRCSLRQVKAREETQRTRSFLYNSIAFALTNTLRLNEFYIHENGITGINFARRQDGINARASRTTHPQVLERFGRLFSEIARTSVQINNPFLWLTKTDVVMQLSRLGAASLLSSAVSCSKTRQNFFGGTHCGKCSQCIDRRFAVYAARLDDLEDASGVYATNFINQPIVDAETHTVLMDYVDQARSFALASDDSFYEERLNELVSLVDYLPEPNESEAVLKVYELCQRHGEQVEHGIQRMREIHDKPFQSVPSGSFLDIVNKSRGEYFHARPVADDLIKELNNTKPGKADDKRYEKLMAKILTILFEPELSDPHPQVRTSNGRLIIDMTFSNTATTGFWYDIKTQYGNFLVVIEFKNMTDLKNEEYDQILNRLNNKRGRFGILVARRKNKLDEERARQRLNDHGKLILTLTDEDITNMLRMLRKGESPTEYIARMHRQFLQEA